MQPETTSAPVQKLIAYSQNQATVNEIMRSLVSHQGWLAPAMLFTTDGGQGADGAQHLRVEKSVVMLSTQIRLPVNELWIFTDRSAAERAQAEGALLGIYAEGIAGTELFRKVDPNLELIRVNPYSPTEQSWQFRKDSFDLVRLWADAIALEESFSNTEELDLKAISKFKGFSIFNHTSGYAITLPNQGGMTNPAVVFTTPDCADAFWAALTEEQRAGMGKFYADGITLIKQLPRQEIDGIYFNAFGPGRSSLLFFNEIEDVDSLDDES